MEVTWIVKRHVCFTFRTRYLLTQEAQHLTHLQLQSSVMLAFSNTLEKSNLFGYTGMWQRKIYAKGQISKSHIQNIDSLQVLRCFGAMLYLFSSEWHWCELKGVYFTRNVIG